MKNIDVAFDIDGTLRANREERHRTEVEPNPRILSLLIATAHSKNVTVHLWSNRGAEYCQQMRKTLHLEKYVKAANCHQKEWRKMQEVEVQYQGHKMMMLRGDCFRPNIAYDDQQGFDGADINIIVREK